MTRRYPARTRRTVVPMAPKVETSQGILPMFGVTGNGLFTGQVRISLWTAEVRRLALAQDGTGWDWPTEPDF